MIQQAVNSKRLLNNPQLLLNKLHKPHFYSNKPKINKVNLKWIKYRYLLIKSNSM